jgi:hypothetical protein
VPGNQAISTGAEPVDHGSKLDRTPGDDDEHDRLAGRDEPLEQLALAAWQRETRARRSLAAHSLDSPSTGHDYVRLASRLFGTREPGIGLAQHIAALDEGERRSAAPAQAVQHGYAVVGAEHRRMRPDEVVLSLAKLPTTAMRLPGASGSTPSLRRSTVESRAARRASSRASALGGAGSTRECRGSGRLEEPHAQLGAKHPACSFRDRSLGHATGLHLVREMGIVETRIHFHVDPREERLSGRLGTIPCDPVLQKLGDRVPVRHDEAAVAPPLAQDAGEDGAVRRNRACRSGTEGIHHAFRPCLDPGAEGRQIAVEEVARGDRADVVIAAA